MFVLILQLNQTPISIGLLFVSDSAVYLLASIVLGPTIDKVVMFRGFHVECSMWRVPRGGFHVEGSTWRVPRGGFHVEGSMWRVPCGGFHMEGYVEGYVGGYGYVQGYDIETGV